MYGGMGSAVTPDLSKGGEIDGDITITGDLKVEGGGSFAFDEIIEGTQVIEKADTEAFLVRKDLDGGDVFVVDTTNNSVILPLNTSGTSNKIKLTGDGTSEIYRYSYDLYQTASLTHYLISASGANFKTSDNARYIDLQHSTSTRRIQSNMSDFNILAGHSGGFGFATIGSTSIYKAIEPVYTDNNASSLKLNYRTGGTDTAGITISSAGLVGVGTTSPSENFHVSTSGDTTARIQAASNSKATLKLDSNEGWWLTNDAAGTYGASNAFHIMTGSNTTQRLSITSAGNVGIGTTAPAYDLQIFNSAGADMKLSGDAVADTKSIHFGNAGTANNHHSITAEGNVGIMKIGTLIDGAGYSIELRTKNQVRFKIDDNAKISLSNNDLGTSNTVFGKNVGENNYDQILDSGTNYNVFIGEEVVNGGVLDNATNNVGVGYKSLYSLTQGDDNLAVGYQSGYSITEGDYNSLLGYKAGVNLTTGVNNTAVGGNALLAGVSNSQNVAVGYQALTSTTSSSNVAVGEKSGLSNTSGTFNTVVGRASFYFNQTGSNNTAIGYNSQFGVSGNSHSNNTSVGYKSMFGITTGTLNVAVGEDSLKDITTGHRNTMLGYQSGENSTTGAYNTALGYQAMRGSSASGLTGDGINVAVGYNALQAITTATNSVAIGGNALDALISGDGNVAVGKNALSTATNGENYNTAIGNNAMANSTNASTDYSVAIGHSALLGGTGESGTNVAIGAFALDGGGTVGAKENVAIGYEAMSGAIETAYPFWNVAIGHQAMGSGAMNGSTSNVAIGYRSGRVITTGNYNALVGHQTGDAITTGSYNTAMGYASLSATTTNTGNTAYGYASGSGISNTSSTNNVLLGGYAGSGGSGNLTQNVVVGTYALDGTGTHNATNSVYIGYQSGSASHAGNTTGNIGIGLESLNGAMDNANYNVAIGYVALSAVTTGDTNIGIGVGAGQSLQTGSNNTIMGSEAGDTMTDTSKTVIIGYQAGDAINSTDADGTVAIGYQAGTSITDGKQNTFVGYQSGEQNDTGNWNTAIGYQAYDDATGAMDSNTVVGAIAGGFANASSDNNVVVGAWALRHGTGQISENVVIGTQACDGLGTNNPNMTKCVFIGKESGSGTWGSSAIQYNTAVGYNTMSNALDGAQHNHTLGYSSLTSLTTGDYNIAIGSFALNDLVSGTSNIAIGGSSGESLTVSATTYVGAGAGKFNVTGVGNTAIGYLSMQGVSGNSHEYNTAVGSNTLEDITTGSSNTAMGYQALANITDGANNIGIGRAAGDKITTGDQNVCVGRTDVSTADAQGQIVIGYLFDGTANTRVHIGNNVSHIYNDYTSNATWTHSSDKRQKKEIKDDTLGLEFINDIRPVTYKHKSPSEFPKEWKAYDENNKEPMGGDKTIHGLIAQEVKEALDKQGVDTFSGWDVSPDGRQQVSFEAFVLPLIKSVQELSEQVKQLKKQLEDK